MGIVFVGGVHGVGKTTACAEATKSVGLEHCSASQLIRAERAEAVPTIGKVVSDVAGNQDLLIRSVRRKLAENERGFLLDGHFVLRAGSGDIEHLPMEVFRALSVDLFVCFEDAPAAIASRIQARDGALESEAVIAHFQSAELQHAQDVAVALNTPLFVLKAFDASGLQELLCQRPATHANKR